MGNLAEAQNAYQKAITLAPNDPGYQRQMAAFSLKYEYQLHQLALPAARKAVILSPNDAATLDLMGQVLFKLNDLTNSGRFFERALQANSQYAPAHLHLGLLLLYQSDPTARLPGADPGTRPGPEWPDGRTIRTAAANLFPVKPRLCYNTCSKKRGRQKHLSTPQKELA